jgi:predicted small lipoprotein YifL
VRAAFALAALLALAACGKQGKLTPVPPRTLPVQGSATMVAPTPEEMLRLQPQAAPTRVDDPVERSQRRPDDPFNLPPSGQ